MEECLVCYKEINPTMSPGLKNEFCGHWHCERCTSILSDHCSICNRYMLNIKRICTSCRVQKVVFQSRECIECYDLCCVSCGIKEYCCRYSANEFCIHVSCLNCAINRYNIDFDKV